MDYDIVPEELPDMNYLDYKAKLLYQIGLTDIDGVKEYLASKCANAPTESKKRIQIDNAARQIMMEYYDGDRSFIFTRGKAYQCYRELKKQYPHAETLYEEHIVNVVGNHGLHLLKKANLIEACALFGEHKLYAI